MFLNRKWILFLYFSTLNNCAVASSDDVGVHVVDAETLSSFTASFHHIGSSGGRGDIGYNNFCSGLFDASLTDLKNISRCNVDSHSFTTYNPPPKIPGDKKPLSECNTNHGTDEGVQENTTSIKCRSEDDDSMSSTSSSLESSLDDFCDYYHHIAENAGKVENEFHDGHNGGENAFSDVETISMGVNIKTKNSPQY